MDAPVALQRALRGLSRHTAEKHVTHWGSSVSVTSAAEPAPNQFYLRDSLHLEVSGDSLCRRDSNATVEEMHQEISEAREGLRLGEDVVEKLGNGSSFGAGMDAKLRLISESMLQTDDDSSRNGSEVLRVLQTKIC